MEDEPVPLAHESLADDNHLCDLNKGWQAERVVDSVLEAACDKLDAIDRNEGHNDVANLSLVSSNRRLTSLARAADCRMFSLD